MQSKPRATEGILDQRTGRHTLTLTLIPKDIPLQQVLRDLADRMARMIEKSTDDGRNYDVQVRITADITVDASQARVDEYITEMPLDIPNGIETVETDGIVFKRTALGWERIE